MQTTNPETLGIAGGALAAALLDVLVSKGVLTNEEGRVALNGALDRVKHFLNTPEGAAAGKAIATLMAGKYSARES